MATASPPAIINNIYNIRAVCQRLLPYTPPIAVLDEPKADYANLQFNNHLSVGKSLYKDVELTYSLIIDSIWSSCFHTLVINFRFQWICARFPVPKKVVLTCKKKGKFMWIFGKTILFSSDIGNQKWIPWLKVKEISTHEKKSKIQSCSTQLLRQI